MLKTCCTLRQWYHPATTVNGQVAGHRNVQRCSCQCRQRLKRSGSGFTSSATLPAATWVHRDGVCTALVWCNLCFRAPLCERGWLGAFWDLARCFDSTWQAHRGVSQRDKPALDHALLPRRTLLFHCLPYTQLPSPNWLAACGSATIAVGASSLVITTECHVHHWRASNNIQWGPAHSCFTKCSSMYCYFCGHAPRTCCALTKHPFLQHGASYIALWARSGALSVSPRVFIFIAHTINA
jgi:hypothetical protein